jgi:hypothetical protein
MLSLAASLTQKWKQTATFTSRLKMPPETTSERLAPHVITVTGEVFYDIGHAPADHSNRRSTPKGYAVWEIHPVRIMEVIP